ncbi:MAG: polyprenyl synthetase family protein [Clostridia bacterium]|nr:polyprenyl synthetase family protein [Clostridia bacterium]
MLQQNHALSLEGSRFDTESIEYIEIVERELFSILSDSKGPIREMCHHIMKAGGKRIRPLLVLRSGLAFSQQSDELIYAAAAAELIHMASLVHDDIIDESPLRRNKPSINQVWGNHYAVLCGDYLFAKAFGILSSNRLMRSMDYMVRAIESMCQGEILQAGDRFNSNVSMKSYYERISKKTAIFLECCCRSGASVAGTDSSGSKIIGEYGLNIGLAFQIIDDILDFCGDENIMGKPKGEDLRQGIITMPMIFLQRDNKYRMWISQLMRNKKITDKEINEICFELNRTGCIKECFKVAEAHINKAKYCIRCIPGNEHTDFLNNLADVLGERIN